MKYPILNALFLNALHMALEKYNTCRHNTNSHNLLSLDPEVVEREMNFTITEFCFNGDPKAPLNYVLGQLMLVTSRYEVGTANVVGQLLHMSMQADSCYERDIESVYMRRIMTAASTVAKLMIGEAKFGMRANLIAELATRILLGCALNNAPETELRYARPLAALQIPGHMSEEILQEALDRVLKIEAMWLEETLHLV